MKTGYGLLTFCMILFMGLYGCESMVQPQAKVDTGLQGKFHCPAKAKVAVARFDWRVNGGGTTTISGLGDTITISHESGRATGLRDMLVTTLVQTQCYRVLERQDFGAIAEEMSLRERGYTKKKTSRKGNIKEADLLVIGAITGWDEGSSGTRGVVGGLFGPVLSGVSGAFSKTSVAMDIRIVDVDTSEVVAATRVEGTGKAISAGGLLGGLIGDVPLGGALSTYAKTPMEKAIRECIYKAVEFIVQNTPKEYFKY